MGGFLTKRWNSPGYYPDMVYGFLSQAGGFPRMIMFPKELLTLPETCNICHRTSGLQWDKMYRMLEIKRIQFRNHVEAVVISRLAKGESDPYPDQSSSSRICRKTSLLGILRGASNLIAPEPAHHNGDTDDNDPCRFKVDPDELIVCDCMGKIKISEENLTTKNISDVKDGCQLDSGDSSSEGEDTIKTEMAILNVDPRS